MSYQQDDYDEVDDQLRAFRAALSDHGRRSLRLCPEVVRDVTAACRGTWTPASLAAYVQLEIRHYRQPAANSLMRWRLARAAGHTDETGE